MSGLYAIDGCGRHVRRRNHRGGHDIADADGVLHEMWRMLILGAVDPIRRFDTGKPSVRGHLPPVYLCFVFLSLSISLSFSVLDQFLIESSCEFHFCLFISYILI